MFSYRTSVHDAIGITPAEALQVRKLKLPIDIFRPPNLKFDKNVVESVIPNPESMPYVLKNEIVNFYVTFKGHLEKPAIFNFSYEDTVNKQPFKTEIVVDPHVESDSFIDRMGHFKRIRLL